MAWTATTGAGTLASGYLASGVPGATTLRWGSKDVVSSINGSSVSGVNYGIVTRFNQKTLVENIKLPNGDGLSVGRVQIIDGQQWDITVRDSTSISNRPQIGSTVVIADGGGLISNGQFKYYAATVVESGWDTAPKQPGEMTITVERLTLIETTAGS